MAKNFDKILNLFSEAYEIKSCNKDREKKLGLARNEALILFLITKEYNRRIKSYLQSTRNELHQVKINADANRLQMENFVYEIEHLKREIDVCYQHKSKDGEINLLSPDEYQSMLSTSSTKRKSDTNRFFILESELKLRKELTKYLKELSSSQNNVLRNIGLKFKRLVSFPSSVNTLIKAAEPLKNTLQLSSVSNLNVEDAVYLLPHPLYMAYMNLHAYNIICDTELPLFVKDSEEQDLANITPLSRKYDKITIQVPNDYWTKNKRNDFLKPHPFVLQFCVGKLKHKNACLVVVLRYFPQLGFVTASGAVGYCCADENKNDKISELGDISERTGDKILKYLIDGDTGDKIPVAGAQYLLSKEGMSTEDCILYLREENLGMPYQWLQKMCCIDVIGHNSKLNDNKSSQFTFTIMKQMHASWSLRTELLNQTLELAHNNVYTYLNNDKLPITKPSCRLAQWSLITYDEYVGCWLTENYIEAGLVNADNSFFKANIVRGSAKMECLVSVSYRFPSEPPLWILCINWHGQQTALNNSAIKFMEFWTNFLSNSEIESKEMISFQLIRTMYSFDIFLETESSSEFPKEHNYLKNFTSRLRLHPFKFITNNEKVEKIFKN